MHIPSAKGLPSAFLNLAIEALRENKAAISRKFDKEGRILSYTRENHDTFHRGKKIDFYSYHQDERRDNMNRFLLNGRKSKSS